MAKLTIDKLNERYEELKQRYINVYTPQFANSVFDVHKPIDKHLMFLGVDFLHGLFIFDKDDARRKDSTLQELSDEGIAEQTLKLIDDMISELRQTV